MEVLFKKNKFDIECIKLLFEDDLEEILKIFFSSTDESIYHLRMAFRSKDVRIIGFESHSLIGSSAVVKADLLYNAAKEINILCKEDRIEQSEQALDKFCTLYFEYKIYVLSKLPNVFK